MCIAAATVVMRKFARVAVAGFGHRRDVRLLSALVDLDASVWTPSRIKNLGSRNYVGVAWMMRLQVLSQTRVMGKIVSRPLSLDSLEVGEKFNINGASLRAVLRALLHSGISESTELMVLSRNQSSICVSACSGPQRVRLRKTHARHVSVQLVLPTKKQNSGRLWSERYR